MQTISKTDTAKVLDTLKSNYRKSYAGMTAEEIMGLADIWHKGLQRIEADYVWQALDWYTYESTEAFAPTIGQFLAKANEFKQEYERKHPVIRNSWEVREEE